jgi:hypothetical protein
VGAVGVKLVAAPDAPLLEITLRGWVLARAPADQHCVCLHCEIQHSCRSRRSGGRRGAASTDTYLLRGFHERPALAKGLDFSEPRTGWSEKCRHVRVRDTPRHQAKQGGRAWESGKRRGQHAKAGISRQHMRPGPYLGRTPSERNHRSVLRLHWRA